MDAACKTHSMTQMSALLESLSGALREVAPVEVAVLSDPDLCAHLDQVEVLGRLVDGLRVAAAAEADTRSGASVATRR